MDKSVKIGPKFFANALRDYSNRHWAFVREMLQNSIDAQSSVIEVIIRPTDVVGDTYFMCQDNGVGMNQDIIENKLLVLGESGKPQTGTTVGGYGKAKELLYFCHKSYMIMTGDIVVDGIGAQYGIGHQDRIQPGTRSIVTWEGDCVKELTTAIFAFARMLNWSGSLFVNGTQLVTKHPSGTFRRDLKAGAVHTADFFPGLMIVRVHGIPMFYRAVNFPRTVVVEVGDYSLDKLVANRDSLQYSIQQELEEFVQALSMNKLKAFGQPTVTRKVFTGNLIKVGPPVFPVDDKATASFYTNEAGVKTLVRVPIELETDMGKMQHFIDMSGIMRRTSGVSANDEELSSTGYRFAIKNTTGMEVPDYLKPGPQFSSYAATLTARWVAALMEVYNRMVVEGEFAVGFLLDEKTIAEYDDSTGTPTFLINPILVVQQQNSTSRSFKSRYKGTTADADAIIATAIHEFTHHQLRSGYHDESFASQITENFARLLPQYADIRKVVRAI